MLHNTLYTMNQVIDSYTFEWYDILCNVYYSIHNIYYTTKEEKIWLQRFLR